MLENGWERRALEYRKEGRGVELFKSNDSHQHARTCGKIRNLNSAWEALRIPFELACCGRASYRRLGEHRSRFTRMGMRGGGMSSLGPARWLWQTAQAFPMRLHSLPAWLRAASGPGAAEQLFCHFLGVFLGCHFSENEENRESS